MEARRGGAVLLLAPRSAGLGPGIEHGELLPGQGGIVLEPGSRPGHRLPRRHRPVPRHRGDVERPLPRLLITLQGEWPNVVAAMAVLAAPLKDRQDIPGVGRRQNLADPRGSWPRVLRQSTPIQPATSASRRGATGRSRPEFLRSHADSFSRKSAHDEIGPGGCRGKRVPHPRTQRSEKSVRRRKAFRSVHPFTKPSSEAHVMKSRSDLSQGGGSRKLPSCKLEECRREVAENKNRE